MSVKYKLSYTAKEIDKRLGMINPLAENVNQFQENINKIQEDISQLSPEDIGAMPDIAVTNSDNGKFLCVVDGVWTATAIDDAEELIY